MDNMPSRQFQLTRKEDEEPNKVAGIILKIIQIICGFICLGLLRYYHLLFPYESRLYLAIITTGGFILISGVLLLGSFMKQGNPPTQEALINLLGAAMYIATGATTVDLYLRYDIHSESTRVGFVFGGLAIVTGFLYIADTFLAVRRQRDDEL
uniref:MARVEL domain-containing protein n=1 Tax=Strigamia maritima TaxID=126957 RepID=T1JD65_STRMM